MNNTFLALLIIATSIALYLPAYWAKFAWSGRGYTKTRYNIMFTYNILMIIFHSYLIESDSVPFQKSLAVVLTGFVSAPLILFHGLAIPSESKKRRWRLHKFFDPTFRRHKLSIDRYRLDHQKKRRWLFNR